VAERFWSERFDRGLSILAAVVGTLPASIAASACVGRYLPISQSGGFARAFMLAVPFWVAGIFTVFLARCARRAWGAWALASILLGLLAYGIPP
jgi:hypothetical protein